MKKVLLTSTGFDNPFIKEKFVKLLNKDVSEAKVLFIITAANDPDSVRILSGCLDDLTTAGIIDSNIKVYDMHQLLTQKEFNSYDAIYVCGGSSKYLIDRMKELNFKKYIDTYLKQGGIYVGVSAGSIAATDKFGLDLITNKLEVHCDTGSMNGKVLANENIYLTDNQALLITDKEKVIFE